MVEVYKMFNGYSRPAMNNLFVFRDIGIFQAIPNENRKTVN